MTIRRRPLSTATSFIAALSFVLGCTVAARGAAAASDCPGDCNGDHAINVDELVDLVDLVFGAGHGTWCANGDLNQDGVIDVTEVVAAVDAALNGCTPNPTPTFTPTSADEVMSSATPTATATPRTAATPCPTGQHLACHSGSGRGGGYKRICSCVNNPPPTPLTCVTAWGTQIPAGSSIVLYDTNTVNAPDTCAAHGTLVSCDASGVLDPPGVTGYPVCTVISTGDD